MKFEDSPTEKYTHRLHIEDDEPGVFGAVYRELVFILAREDRLKELEDYYLAIATWGSGEELYIDTNNTEMIARVLEDFHRRTIDAIAEIPSITAEAPFDNSDIPKRYRLGSRALELAGVIRQEQSTIQFIEQLDEQGPDLFLGDGKG